MLDQLDNVIRILTSRQLMNGEAGSLLDLYKKVKQESTDGPAFGDIPYPP